MIFILYIHVYIALRRLRASNQVEEDIEEMRAEERAQSSESSISIMELICSPTLRAPLIIGIVMQLSQQLSGINAVSILLTKDDSLVPLHPFLLSIYFLSFFPAIHCFIILNLSPTSYLDSLTVYYVLTKDLCTLVQLIIVKKMT